MAEKPQRMPPIAPVAPEHWPEIIRAFRADFGLSQAELRGLLTLGEKTEIISQWESGYRTPKGYLYLALAGLAAVLRRNKCLQVPVETWCKIGGANA